MPQATWHKNGPLAAQLFHDIYFGKYSAQTSVQEIYSDPSRPYCNLNLNTFYKHVKSTRTHADHYRHLGTGLEDESFRELVRLDQPPAAEERNVVAPSDNFLSDDSDNDSLFENNQPSEEDDDIFADVDDVTVDTAF